MLLSAPLPALLCALAALSAGPTQRLLAQEQPFDAAAVVRVAVDLVDREHIAHKPLDDERSKQWFAEFFAALDPRRLYFLDSDLAQLWAYETRLDDLARGSDFSFADLVRARYRQRTAEAAATAKKYLAQEPDFSTDESVPAAFTNYAGTQDEQETRWRLTIKFEQLIEKPTGAPAAEVRKRLERRYAGIAQRGRDMTNERLCEIYLNALLKCYDPKSTYFNPEGSALFRYSHIQPRMLGLWLAQRAGRVNITSINPTLHNSQTEWMIGWQILAIRRLDGTTFDLVEVAPHEVWNLVMWGTGTIENDDEVILHLLHPKTFERRDVQWTRFKRPRRAP